MEYFNLIFFTNKKLRECQQIIRNTQTVSILCNETAILI